MQASTVRPWLVATGCFLIFMINAGMGMNPLALYIAPVTEDLQVSRGGFSLVFTFYGITATVVSLFAFKILKVLKITSAIVIGGVCSGLGYIVFSISNSILIFYIGGLLYGVGAILAGYLTLQLVVTNWFVEKRGFVIGLVAASSGLGSAIFSPIIADMIINIGWRASCLITGIIIMVTVLLSVIFLIKPNPEALGLLPYGVNKISEEKTTNGQTREVPGIMAKEAVKTAPFWAITIAIFLVSFALKAMITQHAAMIQDKGFSLEQAGFALSVYSIANMVNKLVAGTVADKAGIKLVSFYCGVGFIASCGLMLMANSFVAIIGYAVLSGFLPAIISLYGILASASLFGRKDIGALNGFSHSSSSIAALFSPAISGMIFTLTGSYFILILACIVMAILFMVLTFWALRERNLFEAQINNSKTLKATSQVA